MRDPFQYQRPEWLEQFLAAHPEHARAIELAEARTRRERQTLAWAAREIRGFVSRGVPSRWGLIVTLRVALGMLEENYRHSRRPTTDADGQGLAETVTRRPRLLRLAVYTEAGDALNEFEISFSDRAAARAFGRLVVLITAGLLGEPRARRRLERERDALQRTIARGIIFGEVGGDLERRLGERLTPFITSYLAGRIERAGDEELAQLRLATAAEIEHSISERRNPGAAKAWLLRANAALAGKTPAQTIRHAQSRAELQAVTRAAADSPTTEPTERSP